MNTLDITLTPALKWLLVLLGVFALVWVTACITRKDEPLDPVRPHLFKTEANMWSWGYIARNGVTVHTSNRAHADRSEALAHYAEVRRRMENAAVPDLVTRAKEEDRRYRWNMFGGNTILECSDQTFATANVAKENYRDLREAMLDCPPQDIDVIHMPLTK